MNNKVEHIIPKVFVLLLMAVLLFPSTLQFHHIFETHDHNNDCKEVTTHLHEKEVDCSLCDFNVTQTYYHPDFQISFDKINVYQKQNFELYKSKYYHQQLSYSLRGPPQNFT